jgi:hypothetical protein
MFRAPCSVGFLFVFLAAAPAFARWEGPSDDKPLTVLQEMDLKALFNEGFDVCVRRAVVASGVPPDTTSPLEAAAGDYLSIIESVVRDKNRGKMPEWMRALSFARTTKECQSVFRGYLSGELTDTKPAQAPPTLSPETPTAPTLQPSPQPTAAATAKPRPKRKPKPSVKPTPIVTPSAAPQPSTVAPSVAKPKSQSKPIPKSGEVVDELPPWMKPR